MSPRSITLISLPACAIWPAQMSFFPLAMLVLSLPRMFLPLSLKTSRDQPLQESSLSPLQTPFTLHLRPLLVVKGPHQKIFLKTRPDLPSYTPLLPVPLKSIGNPHHLILTLRATLPHPIPILLPARHHRLLVTTCLER